MSNLATLKPFQKGDDPRRNVTGKNKGSKWLTTRLEEALEQKAEGKDETYSDLLVKRELKNAIIDGEQRAIEHIWDRIEGKPVERTVNLNLDANSTERTRELGAKLISILRR